MAHTNFIRRFVRNNEGNAVVEYAILLGLIAAVTILGLDVLSRTTESALSQVGGALGNGGVPLAAGQPSPAIPPEVRLQAEVANTNLWIGVTISGGLVATLFACILISWHKTRKKLDEVSEHTGSVERVSQQVKYVQPKLIAKRQHILKTLAMNIDRLLHSTLQVKQLMSTNVATIHPDMLIEDLKAHMAKLEVRHILVTSHEGKLLGVISDRDVKGKPGQNAGHIMSRDPISVGPDMEISPAVTMMLDNSISCLPIVEHGELKGIVTSTDLMMAVQCCLHVLRNATSAMEEAASGSTVGVAANQDTLGQEAAFASPELSPTRA